MSGVKVEDCVPFLKLYFELFATILVQCYFYSRILPPYSLIGFELKLDIALGYLKQMMGAEKAAKLKVDFLKLLRDKNTVLFSNLFTLTFVKDEKIDNNAL